MAVETQKGASAADLPAALVCPAGVVPGAEPTAHIAGARGALVLHGLTGSPWEVRPLAERLEDAGYSVAMPLLAGHGGTLEELTRSRWQDWLASARAAMNWLELHVDRVHIVGLSMGALLSLLLAGQASRRPIASLTLLAPALGLPLGVASGLRLARRVGWPRVLSKGPVTLHGGVQPPSIPAMPVAALRSLVELNEVLRDCQPRILAPTLALHGEADRTIPLAVGRRGVRELFGDAVSVEVVPGAGHLLPRTDAGQAVCHRVVGFMTHHDGAPFARSVDW